MKLLLDQDVPRRAAALLREAGVDAIHASEAGLSSADDAEIVAWCRVQEAVAVVHKEGLFLGLQIVDGRFDDVTVRAA